MRRLRTVVALAALAAGAAGAETFGVQAGVGNLGLHLGAYTRVAGFGPVQAEVRGTFDRGFSSGAQTVVGADGLVSVNLLLLRPYGGFGVGLPLDGGGGTSVRTTLGARFGLPGPFSGFAEGSFGARTVYRAGLLLRF